MISKFFNILLFLITTALLDNQSISVLFLSLLISFSNISLAIGLLLPIASFFNPVILLSFFLFQVFFDKKNIKQGLLVGAPIILIFLISVLIDIYYEIDIKTIFSFITGDIRNLREYIISLPFGWVNNLTLLISYSLFFVLIPYLRDKINNSFYIGLIISLSVSMLLGFLEVIGFDSGVKTADFWLNQGRYSFTFSDPNAFGLFALISITLLFDYSRKQEVNYRRVLYGFVILLFLLGLYSGSRTYILGFILILLIFLFQKRKKVFCIISLLILAIFISHNILIECCSSYIILVKSILPQGIHRVVDVLAISNLKETFFSRFIFNKINLAVIFDYPVSGVGFNHFRSIMPEYKSVLDSSIGTWSDNSNNFYLGLISECGIIGLFSLLLVSLKFKLQRNSKIITITSFVFLFLLVLGPHVEFIEIMLILAVLFSQCFEYRDKKFNIKTKILLLICLLVFTYIHSSSSIVSRGLYSEEKEGDRLYRWTTNRALLVLDCDKSFVSVRAVHPDIIENPVMIKTEIDGIKSEVELGDSSINKIAYSCKEQGSVMKVHVKRIFKPSDYFETKDNRTLGIQVLH